jgi:transposase
MEDLQANILKCEKELKALQENLKQTEQGKIFKGKKCTTDYVCNKIRNILSKKHMKKIFSYTVSTDNKKITMIYSLDNDNFNYVVDKYLGKTIIFTNRCDWSNEQIVSTYNTQFQVEESFKEMKNLKVLSSKPVKHFTDRCIIVHSFYSVIALTLCSLLQLEMENLGYKLGINDLLNELKDATQSLDFYHSGQNQKITAVPVFSEASEIAKTYIEYYDLRKFAFK